MTKQVKFPKKITAAWLRSHDACEKGIDAFSEVFPKGAVVNVANVVKALDEELPLGFLLDLLPREDWKVYHAAVAEPLKVYNAAVAEPLKVYHAAVAEARKVYDAAVAEAWKVYHAAVAEPFVKAWNMAVKE